jgi:hypothetical protein
MTQYIVLKPISLATGPIIEPAPAPTPADPEPAPVLLDETQFGGDTPEAHAAGIALLIEQGVIAVYDPPKKARKATPEE